MDMKKITFKPHIKTVTIVAFAIVLLGLFVKEKTLSAQTTGAVLTGTFVCPSSSHMAGYMASMTADTGSTGVNQMFTISFDATSNTATISGLVGNYVNNFEKTNASTSTVATANSLQVTVVPNTPSAYLYKMIDASKTSNNTYYLGLTNSGNTLLFMGAPNTTSSMHGACQKV